MRTLASILGSLLLFLSAASAEAQSTTVVIAEVYGGGGNAGAIYLNVMEKNRVQWKRKATGEEFHL